MKNNTNEKHETKKDNNENKDVLIINKIKIEKSSNIKIHATSKKIENRSKHNKYNSSNFNFFNSMIKQSREELNKINIISEKKMQERLKLAEKNSIKYNIKEVKTVFLFYLLILI